MPWAAFNKPNVYERQPKTICVSGECQLMLGSLEHGLAFFQETFTVADRLLSTRPKICVIFKLLQSCHENLPPTGQSGNSLLMTNERPLSVSILPLLNAVEIWIHFWDIEKTTPGAVMFVCVACLGCPVDLICLICIIFFLINNYLWNLF